MQVLLLEPLCSVREMLQRIFAERGWVVTLAQTAEEALQHLTARPFPLVVLDRELPDDRDVASLCRDIRSLWPAHAARVLVVTPEATPELVRELARSGADDFLLRPFSAPQVGSRLALAEGQLAATGGERMAELEETVHVQKALLEELFQSAPEGIVVVDEHDRVVRINTEFSRMFGYSDDEARGQPINDLIVPESELEAALVLTQGVRQGERFLVETTRRRRDGSLLDVSVLATPIHVGEGAIGAYGIYRDITDRKAHQRALEESETRYRALFDQSPVGVFLCDADLRITHCNRRLSRIAKAPREEIIGTRLLDLQDDRVRPNLAEALAGRPAFYEGPYRVPRQGGQLWVSIRYAPLHGPDGRIIGGMGVLEDISEREKSQRELQAQAAELERVNSALRERTLELEAAMRARSRLYSALNHELRTPISSIMLYQELLLAGTLGPLADEQQEALERSHSAARHLLELVQDVLDLSKIEAGKVTVHPVEISLPTLLEDLHATALPLAQRYGSEIDLEITGDQQRIVTDPQRVRQILLNFLSNAAKFGRGNPILIRCGTMATGEVSIEVVDRGIGIAATDLPHVFEDFVQVGTTQEGGTGLGLAISRHLAELLGGRLEVTSELEQGSTFRLVLPQTISVRSASQENEAPQI